MVRNGAIAVTILFSPLFVMAHPYLPLKEGVTREYSYAFHVETTRPEFKQADTKGKIHVHAVRFEERYGKRYLRFETKFEGIPFMQEDVVLWRREEGGAVYMASERDGKMVETIELPAVVDVGSTWDYSDGEPSVRKVMGKVAVKLPDASLDDCIEVVRTVTKNPALKSVVNKNFYCRDVGDSGSLFQQPSPVGDYITETKLVR